MKKTGNRVVVTGMGVLAPNGHGLPEFEQSLRAGRSGIRSQPGLAELGFACQIAGVPHDVDATGNRYFDGAVQFGMDRHAIIGCIAGLDCWTDSGLPVDCNGRVDWDTGITFGSGIGGIETIGKSLAPMTDAGRVRRLGSTIPERIMGSAVSARLAGLLGVGGQVTSNSSACATGAEAVVEGYWAVREGRSARVLAGGCEADSRYIWAAFDAMRVLSRKFNHAPEQASRPLSSSAGGFVPAAGAGAVMLESLQSALERGARIYAEVIGGSVNCGGQRNGGSMTLPNGEGVRRCIRRAIQDAGIAPEEIDLISGHLTSTMADTMEAGNWRCALELDGDRFPLINAPKSLFGHALGAAGAIECVAAILQVYRGFVHPSLNCEDLHPDLEWLQGHVPRECLERDLRIVAKASFGFGDVSACALFEKYDS